MVREGFDPRDVKPASLNESAMADEDEADKGDMAGDLDDSRHWSREDGAEGEGSKRDGRPRLGSLGDSNVWNGHAGSSL